jgi:hypothetical protein
MKQKPLPSHSVKMRRLRHLAPVTTQVIPGDVIGDEEDEIGLLGVGDGKQANDCKKKNDSFHILFN